MIDLIIPIYNDYPNLRYTLCSIAMQTIKDMVTVYIIDNNSNLIYENIINEFQNDLNIKYIKLKNKLNNGNLKQFCLENSNNEYIVFMNSNDVFSNPLILSFLYKEMLKGYDYVHSTCFYENTNEYLDNDNSLTGKIFSRNFIIKNNIKFNNSDSYEDLYFNSLIALASNNNAFLDMTTYTANINLSYTSNKSTLENSKFFLNLEFFIKNIREILNYANSKQCTENTILNTLASKTSYISNIFFDGDEIHKALLKGWFLKYNLKSYFEKNILSEK